MEYRNIDGYRDYKTLDVPCQCSRQHFDAIEAAVVVAVVITVVALVFFHVV